MGQARGLGPRADSGNLDPAQAATLLNGAVACRGPRDPLRAATAIGAGAIAPAWMLSPGVEDVAAQAGGDGPGPPILQSGRGRRVGSYITSTPETVRWGFL